jgi:hypothetical protein
LESVIEAHLDRSSVKMGFATLEEQLTWGDDSVEGDILS